MSVVKKKGRTNYYIRFTIDGVRIQECAHTTNKTEARLYEEKRKREVRQEILLGQKPKKLWTEAAKKWIKERAHKKTISQDIRTLAWINKHWKDKYLQELTKKDITHLITLKQKNKVSSATINRLLSLIKAIFNQAKTDWEWVDSFPYIKQLKEPPGRVKWLTKEEAGVLLSQLPNHLKLMARFSLATGLRQSNVKNLQWSDIDLVNKRLIVKGEHFKNGNNFGIPLNNEALSVLQEILSSDEKHAAYIFVYKGNKISQLSTKAWFKALKRCGIEDFRWHDLRHTWASWFVQSGGSLQELQVLGGWKNFNMVLRYAHLCPDHLIEAANRINNMFSEKNGPQLVPFELPTFLKRS